MNPPELLPDSPDADVFPDVDEFSGEDVPESVAVCPPDDVPLSDALPDAVADRNTPLFGS